MYTCIGSACSIYRHFITCDKAEHMFNFALHSPNINLLLPAVKIRAVILNFKKNILASLRHIYLSIYLHKLYFVASSTRSLYYFLASFTIVAQVEDNPIKPIHIELQQEEHIRASVYVHQHQISL